MNKEDALKELWRRKCKWEDAFGRAVLLVDCEMSVWNGKHPVEENSVVHVAKAGTPVFIASISRFGDLGIRDDRLDKKEYGYYTRVLPEALDNLELI